MPRYKVEREMYGIRADRSGYRKTNSASSVLQGHAKGYDQPDCPCHIVQGDPRLTLLNVLEKKSFPLAVNFPPLPFLPA